MLTSGREKTIWGREFCKNGRDKKYNGDLIVPSTTLMYSCVSTRSIR